MLQIKPKKMVITQDGFLVAVSLLSRYGLVTVSLRSRYGLVTVFRQISILSLLLMYSDNLLRNIRRYGLVTVSLRSRHVSWLQQSDRTSPQKLSNGVIGHSCSAKSQEIRDASRYKTFNMRVQDPKMPVLNTISFHPWHITSNQLQIWMKPDRIVCGETTSSRACQTPQVPSSFNMYNQSVGLLVKWICTRYIDRY